MSSERGKASAMKMYEEACQCGISMYEEACRCDISKSLHHRVVEELQTHIFDIVHKKCYGCTVDHPSQLQHPLCLFTTKDEWVDLFIYEAFEKLDMYKVMAEWYEELKQMAPSSAEKAAAYQLWNSIKTSVGRNVITSQPSLISEWSERVKGAWNHGDH
jgi:hypothetical protein